MEKWCIKVTKENIAVVGEYYNKKCRTNGYTDSQRIGKYFTSNNLLDGKSIITETKLDANFILHSPSSDYPEITTEEFFKLIGVYPTAQEFIPLIFN